MHARESEQAVVTSPPCSSAEAPRDRRAVVVCVSSAQHREGPLQASGIWERVDPEEPPVPSVTFHDGTCGGGRWLSRYRDHPPRESRRLSVGRTSLTGRAYILLTKEVGWERFYRAPPLVKYTGYTRYRGITVSFS